MTYKTFTLILMSALTLESYGATDSRDLEVRLTEAGTLQELYLEQLANPEVTSVSIEGPVNDDDISMLNAASRKYSISSIDLANATIEGDMLPDEAFSTYVDAPDSPESRLASIILPDNLTAIGDFAFEGLTQLREVKLPAGLKEIGYNAFSGCTALKSIALPEGMTEIGAGSFINCTSLKSVEFPSSLSRIKSNAFEGTGIEEIHFPDGLKRLDRCAFKSASLKSLILPESCTEYKANVFESNKQLTHIELPSSMTIIPYGIFNHCTSLFKIDIPEGTKRIGREAFSECTSLCEINLPSTLTVVEGFAFYNFNGETLTLPENFIAGTLFSFYGSKPLKTLYSKNINAPIFYGTTNMMSSEDASMNVPDRNTPVYIPKGSLDSYFNWWSYLNNFIEVDEFPSSGIENIEADENEVIIHGNLSGEIILEGFEGEYEVYATDGRKVAAGSCSGSINIQATPGLYLVKTGRIVKKVIIK